LHDELQSVFFPKLFSHYRKQLTFPIPKEFIIENDTDMTFKKEGDDFPGLPQEVLGRQWNVPMIR
jgi:hypothetical protein